MNRTMQWPQDFHLKWKDSVKGLEGEGQHEVEELLQLFRDQVIGNANVAVVHPSTIKGLSKATGIVVDQVLVLTPLAFPVCIDGLSPRPH